jgi:hypothetical protein
VGRAIKFLLESRPEVGGQIVEVRISLDLSILGGSYLCNLTSAI